jgi:hypothetical protein
MPEANENVRNWKVNFEGGGTFEVSGVIERGGIGEKYLLT